MKKLVEVIEQGIKYDPASLLSLEKNAIKYADTFLPFSVGIEIECFKGHNFDINTFRNIPNIVDVNVDDSEQRFRIPKGLEGLVCLFDLCKQLKRNSELNHGSGIHYHIDMTDKFHLLNSELVTANEEWVLSELDIWNYRGKYNCRAMRFNANHNWVRFQSGFKTAEFRIGEMSFEYSLLCTRILHASSIVERFFDATPTDFKLKALRKRMLELLKDSEEFESNSIKSQLDIIKEAVKNRIVK